MQPYKQAQLQISIVSQSHFLSEKKPCNLIVPQKANSPRKYYKSHIYGLEYHRGSFDFGQLATAYKPLLKHSQLHSNLVMNN